jgi:hypothetical protein
MKKYIYFAFHDHYPAGGLGDIKGSYDTLDEAKTAASAEYYDTREVVDRDTWEVVWTA